MDHVDALLSVSAALPAQLQRAATEEESPAGPLSPAFADELATDRGPAHAATRLDSREPVTGDDVPEYDLSWGDVLDVINPLQHIPIVSSFYRTLTGDTISGSARVLGSTLYGGPIGMIAGAANAIMAEVNGADLGDTLVAGLLGEELPDAAIEGGTLLAEAEAPPDAAPELVPAAASLQDTAETEEAPPSLASAFAPLPKTPGQTLTGDAALSALMGDLRVAASEPQSDGVKPAPTAAVTSEPLPPTPQHTGIVSAQAPGAVPLQAFAKQMMLGLDKYQALATERGGAGRPDPKSLDQSL